MSIIIRDPTLQAQLTSVAEVALYDSSGKPLGHFVSPDLFRMLLKEYADSQVSLEELERRFHETGGSSLQEIWARLQSAS